MDMVAHDFAREGIRNQAEIGRALVELMSNLVYGIRPRSYLIDPVLVRRP
ncbi:MAG: hypothetical protein AWU57_10 [Marinobacter sp. T13-3]|nr:MAG: hypothetical protein AWU57_10 [Marinobacter sp. T13-3]